jgi:hypothetical protein
MDDFRRRVAAHAADGESSVCEAQGVGAMQDDPLLQVLRSLEVEMHQPQVRSDRARMEQLLHPEFLEIGRSGAIYTRADVLKEFARQPLSYTVWSQDFAVTRIAPMTAMLLYRSAHIDHAGSLDRHTMRASIWQSTEQGWQVRFHQGTPCEGFSKD